MADNSWITPFDNTATQSQYINSPSGKRYQALTGGWFMAPDGKMLRSQQELANYEGSGGAAPGGEMASSLNTQMMSDIGKYGGQMGAHLGNTPTRQANPFGVPTMETGNRFEAGLAGNERRLNALLDDPESIRQTAAYKFRVGQGQEALQRSLAAKGMLGSGNRLMELTKYGQDMGSQEYEAQHNRLAGLVGMYGQNWIGDKNANTQRFTAGANAWQGGEQAATQQFGAESDLWGKKAGTLADLYRTGVSGAGTAASLWSKQQDNQPISRLSTNMDMSNYRSAGFA